MNQDPDANMPPDSPDDDQPLQVLRDHESETGPEFTARVRRRIYRRAAAAQVASFSWHLPKVVLLEMAGLFRHVLGSVGGNKESSQ